jgi:uncharacterized protein
MNRRTTLTVPVAAAILATGLAVAGPLSPGSSAQSATTPTSPSSSTVTANGRAIVVTGVGRASDRPDTVTISVGVETSGTRARDALTSNSTNATKVIDLFKDRGVAAADIQTSNLSIQPRYDRNGQRVTGYTVNNSVIVRVRGIEKAGPIVDAAADLAGDTIRLQGLSFSISNTAPLLKKAREAAVQDAKDQAQTVAAAAGERLGRLRLIRVVDVSVPVPYAADFAAARSATAEIPIQAGSQELTAQVELVYDLA